jgi:hypothetical protein
MLKRYWFVWAPLAACIAAFLVTLQLAATRPIAFVRPSTPEAPPRPARPEAVVRSEPLGRARRYAAPGWLMPATVAGVVAGAIVSVAIVAAILARDGRADAAPAATPCDNFGHVQSLFAGAVGTDGSTSLAERVLDETDDSPRIRQLRAMFDSCYKSSKQ